jgi:hypothetical protein
MSSDVQERDLVPISDRRRRTWRPGIGDAWVGAVSVIEGLELAQCVYEVVLVPDQGAVEESSPTCVHPAALPKLGCWRDLG